MWQDVILALNAQEVFMEKFYSMLHVYYQDDIKNKKRGKEIF